MCVKSTGENRIPFRGDWHRGKCFHVMMSSWNLVSCWVCFSVFTSHHMLSEHAWNLNKLTDTKGSSPSFTCISLCKYRPKVSMSCFVQQSPWIYLCGKSFSVHMMTSGHGHTIHITNPLCRESISNQWIFSTLGRWCLLFKIYVL